MSRIVPFTGAAGRGCPPPLNLLASRATSLGRLRLPPIPRDGGALAARLRRDGSRGGDALRFRARYGSSDSLRMAAPPRGAYPRVGWSGGRHPRLAPPAEVAGRALEPPRGL